MDLEAKLRRRKGRLILKPDLLTEVYYELKAQTLLPEIPFTELACVRWPCIENPSEKSSGSISRKSLVYSDLLLQGVEPPCC